MNEIQTRATAISEKPVKAGDLAVVKRNILENSREYDKGMVGGYSGTFPLTTATKGGIYLMPSTGKFYVCETDYNGSNLSAPNSNFVELSVWKNHDRLSNLISMSRKKQIINDSDLNEFKKEGYYFVGTHKHNCKNIPSEASKTIFYLIVFESYYIYQMLLSGNSKIYSRTYNADQNQWNNWI